MTTRGNLNYVLNFQRKNIWFNLNVKIFTHVKFISEHSIDCCVTSRIFTDLNIFVHTITQTEHRK